MKKMKRIFALLLMIVIVLSAINIPVFAEEGYTPTDPYTIYYGRQKGHILEELSPYMPLLTYDVVNETFNTYVSTATLYDGDLCFPAFCVDEHTDVIEGTTYQRVNLEDSDFFSADTAAKLRAIYLAGYYNQDADDDGNIVAKRLGEAAGVEGLTQGEAIHATQLAIWKTSYGDALHIDRFIDKTNGWGWYPSITHDYASFKEEYDICSNASDFSAMSSRIEKAYDYLMNLEPIGPQAMAVSGASFVDWSDTATVSDNGDGTCNVSVSATVNVTVGAGDSLTLTAVLGNYHTSTSLVNGTQTATLTLNNVPTDVARDDITLAIDGEQSITDVCLYVPEGGRYVSQELIGIYGNRLPVHAEVTLEQERVLNFHKSTVVNGANIPLEGIVFDIYYAYDWDDFVNGQITLPKVADISGLGSPDYTVTTDSKGFASLSLTKNNMSDGVYAVVERQHSAIVAPVDPFYVVLPTTSADGSTWEYTVNIYPKNEVEGDVRILKDVIRLDNDLASVDAYKAHPWIVSTSIPKDIADGKYYTITDTLDNRLDFLGNVKVRVESLDGETVMTTLTEDVDYTLTVTDVDSVATRECDAFVVDLTSAGRAKVAAAVASGTGIFTDYMIRTWFDAQINANAVVAVHIPNQAFLKYKNSVGFVFDVESDIPEVYTCGLRLLKVDAADHTKILKGAEFQVYRAATEEEVADETIEKTTVPGYAAQMIPVTFSDEETFKTPKVDTVTTDEEGKAVIYGLAEGTYYFVETKAPAGYNKLDKAIEVQASKTSHIVDVETGYNPTVIVENVGGPRLPDTGGMGTTMFTISGILLICLAVSGLIFKKRRLA